MFGMILDGKSRKTSMAHPFKTAIVQIDMCQLNSLLVQTVNIHCKTMVLR